MLNEEVSKETTDAAARYGKAAFRKALQLTGKELKDLVKLMKTAPEKVMEKLDQPGKEMSVKEILKKDAGAQSIDIAELGIGNFRPIAKRYGMDFAVVKSRYLDPPKYTVFFRARDADTVERVMGEYAAKQLARGKERPSLLAALKRLKALAASIPHKAVEKRKEVDR